MTIRINFKNNLQKTILGMFRRTTPSSEDKNWLIMQLNKYDVSQKLTIPVSDMDVDVLNIITVIN